MMQRRGYFISHYDSTVFRTWGQKQYQQALHQHHKPIVRREYLIRYAWELERNAEVLPTAA